jgi:hypothetical protein
MSWNWNVPAAAADLSKTQKATIARISGTAVKTAAVYFTSFSRPPPNRAMSIDPATGRAIIQVR